MLLIETKFLSGPRSSRKNVSGKNKKDHKKGQYRKENSLLFSGPRDE
jgi:hypothetical protein